MIEMWREVKEFEGLYEVSNTGEVRSIKRNGTLGGLLKPQFDKDGYPQVCLCKNNKKYCRKIHRLVAMAFIENSNNLPVINHKDENKQNNNVDNLEWCSIKYNSSYNNIRYKAAKKRYRPVIAKKDNEILIFNSVSEAADALGVSIGNVASCASDKYINKTAKGYSFEYLDLGEKHDVKKEVDNNRI